MPDRIIAITPPSIAQQPLQPLVMKDEQVRFKPNEIVQFLLDAGRQGTKVDMNLLALIPFTQEDREQFAQLIGYSLSGFSELSYVTDDTYERASAQPIYGNQPDQPKKRHGEY